MSDSRTAIFAKMRAAINREATSAAATEANGTVSVAKEALSTVPDAARARPDLAAVDWVERFVLKVEASGATVTRVRDRRAIATAILDF